MNVSICIVGSIASGKTTLSEALVEKDEDNNYVFIGEDIKKWQKDGLFSKLKNDPINYTYAFECITLKDRFVNINTAYEKNKYESTKKTFILERDLLSNRIFFDISDSNGYINDMERKNYNEQYNTYLRDCKIVPDLYIYLRPKITTLISRQKIRNRTDEKVSFDYQKQLIDAHDIIFNHGYAKFMDKNIPVFVIEKTIDINNLKPIIDIINNL